MTNGRGAGMASFMTKKKKYKFQVDICLEELLEVPFVSAVLFAKLRLLDGGSFQDHSSREEVRDHKVKWDAKFSFPCKMMANASTGVLERCVLRISVRKECKGGRSFTKLGFVDLNLAEYAGAGVTYKKALLEGYDARHRQDNSMLKFSIAMNMLSGDILFKVPSPSLKHKALTTEDSATEPRSDEFSSGSLGGSIASGSSGFGSLPKKRTPLLTSDLVIGHTLPESNIPITIASDCNDQLPLPVPEHEEGVCETGHSRNSSNTSQLSKASGYSSIHSHTHSRQSSSGDSGHIRGLPHTSLRKPNIINSFPNNSSTFTRVNTYPNRLKIPNTVHSFQEEVFSTPQGVMQEPHFTPHKKTANGSLVNDHNLSLYFTPKSYNPQTSSISNSSTEDYRTPDESFSDVFSQNYVELQKSQSASVVERLKSLTTSDIINNRKSDNTHNKPKLADNNRLSLDEANNNNKQNNGVLRSKSEFEIPRVSPVQKNERRFPSRFFKSDSLYSFLTPRPKRKDMANHSTPNRPSPSPTNSLLKIPGSPILKRQLHSLPETRTTSLSSLRSATTGAENQQFNVQSAQRSLPHRKLLEGSSGGKLAPLAISPDETPTTVSSDCSQIPTIRRPSVTTNPSSSSLVLSETGSLDRAKAAYERRKKTQIQDSEMGTTVPGRVEITRVNPDHLIAELIKNTNLEQADDSAETSGLQLFIAKDGTAALGNHEVKSQMSTGAQVFKQVVMDDNR